MFDTDYDSDETRPYSISLTSPYGSDEDTIPLSRESSCSSNHTSNHGFSDALADDVSLNADDQLFTKLEICGLFGTTNGRSCINHSQGCGKNVNIGDTITFNEVFVDGENAVAAIKVDSGCHVGFVNKNFREIWPLLTGEPTYGKVVQLYALSEEKETRRYSHTQKGVALLHLMTCFLS
jgi:hypothetical protein